MLESLSNKDTGLKTGNFIKKWLQHIFFPVHTAQILRTAFFYRTPPVAVFVS